MTDARLTVVRCAQCHGSDVLTLHAARLWCAHCQTWPPLALERHPASVLRPAHGTVAPTTPPRRQPLRVPPGWCIEYHEWYEGELGDPELQQDLVLGTHADRDRVLDLSWYHGDRETACYRVAVWAGREPGPLLHVAEHDTHAAALAAVEDLLTTIAAGRL